MTGVDPWSFEDRGDDRVPPPSYGEPSTLGVSSEPLEDQGAVDAAIALGRRLLGSVRQYAASLALPDIGTVDLPPVVGSAADQAHLRVVPPLYLASELESTQLLASVELLSGLFVGGGLRTEVGQAGPLLVQFWKKRHERLAAAERTALFSRLFGAASGPGLATQNARNDAFDPLMIDLTEALASLAQNPVFGGMPVDEARISILASQLAANLVPRSGGLASYAADDLLRTVQEAIDILKVRELQGTLGARDVWGAVRALSLRYMTGSADIGSHVTRGKSGMIVLTWLAEALPSLEIGTSRFGAGRAGPRAARPDASISAAAVAWLQSSLALAERNDSGNGRDARA